MKRNESSDWRKGEKRRKRKRKLTKQKLKNHAMEGGTWAHRDLNLKNIGFDSYRQYMKSRLWKDIKFAVLSSKGELCEICGNKYSVVHHNRYAKQDLEGVCLDHLHPMCSNCHKIVHHDDDGKFIEKMKHVRERYCWLKDIFERGGRNDAI